VWNYSSLKKRCFGVKPHAKGGPMQMWVKTVRIFLIVDALDTCRSLSDLLIQEKFVKGIRHLTATKWNILITFRSGTLSESKIQSDREMKIEAHETDIKLYVEMRIKESKTMSQLIQQCAKTDDLFEATIWTAITRKAHGMSVSPFPFNSCEKPRIALT
jgi:hypothetical protein